MSLVSMRGGRTLRFTVTLMAALVVGDQPADAGNRNLRNNSVGGVSIDVEGVLGPPSAEATRLTRTEVMNTLEKVPGDLVRANVLRKVSLKQIEATISDALQNNLGVLPDEVKYLAGLQRIEYVLVYPEQNDVVLAGPGEGWSVNERGNVVGVTTGRPVMLLDDLIVALRTVDDARRVGISCSIDPTEDGRRRLDTLLRQLRVFDRTVPNRIEQAMGPQAITITGVPALSHFARVMVAADYRMKRYAMKLEPSPVRGLVSFVEMTTGRTGNMMPRWWLACNYDGIARSGDGLTWQLRGAGVKVMTEEDHIAADGTVTSTGQKDAVAQRWADMMTEKYDELSKHDQVFGELRNLMDLGVVAALIRKEQLLAKAGCSLPLLTTQDSMFVTDSWNPPKTVSTQASAMKKGREWIITASGGVQIESWQVVDNVRTDKSVGQVHAGSKPPENNAWRWN